MRLKSFTLSYGTQFLKALSDESRVRILHLIFKNKEMCTSDIEHVLDFTQTKTSRHLTYLRNANLIASRKEDQWVYYYIKDEAADFVQQILSYFDKDPQLSRDLDIFNTLYSNRELAIYKIRNRRYFGESIR